MTGNACLIKVQEASGNPLFQASYDPTAPVLNFKPLQQLTLGDQVLQQGTWYKITFDFSQGNDRKAQIYPQDAPLNGLDKVDQYPGYPLFGVVMHWNSGDKWLYVHHGDRGARIKIT